MRTNYVTRCASNDGAEQEVVARHKTQGDAQAYLERLAKRNNAKVEFEETGNERYFGKCVWQWYVQVGGKKYRNYYEPQD